MPNLNSSGNYVFYSTLFLKFGCIPVQIVCVLFEFTSFIPKIYQMSCQVSDCLRASCSIMHNKLRWRQRKQHSTNWDENLVWLLFYLIISELKTDQQLQVHKDNVLAEDFSDDKIISTEINQEWFGSTQGFLAAHAIITLASTKKIQQIQSFKNWC